MIYKVEINFVLKLKYFIPPPRVKCRGGGGIYLLRFLVVFLGASLAAQADLLQQRQQP